MNVLQINEAPPGSVITVLGPNGQPVLLFVGDSAGTGPLLQLDWYIDPINGSDTNDGRTPATALRTDAERQRRWGQVTLLGAGGPYTVTYMSNLPPEDPVNFPNVLVGLDAGLRIRGQTTVAKTPDITAVRTLNRATQTPWAITSADLNAGDIFGRLIRIVGGGGSDGAYARIVKDEGANVFRTTPFQIQDFPNINAAGQVTPTAADNYEVINLPAISCGIWQFSQMSNGQPQYNFGGVPNNAVSIETLIVNGGFDTFQGVIWSSNLQVWAFQCMLQDIGLCGPALFTIEGCLDGFSFVGAGAFVRIAGGASLLTTEGGFAQLVATSGAQLLIDGDWIFQDASVALNAGCDCQMGLVSFFDQSASDIALFANPGATVTSRNLFYGADLIWGTNNSGHAVKMGSGAKLLYVTKPTVNGGLGAGREALVGATDKQWGAIPFNDSGATASTAAIVAYT